MRYFPLFVDMQDAEVLIVGGGAIAERKWRLLARTSAHIRIVAPELNDALAHAAESGDVVWQSRPVRDDDIGGQRLIIAATADATVNRRVAALARDAGVLVNVVDDRDHCTAIMPALVERGRLTVAIGSQGVLPVLARRVRERIEAMLPNGMERFIELAAGWRDTVRQRLPAEATRGFWEAAIDTAWSADFAESDAQITAALARRLEQQAGDAPAPGRVVLLGGGPGDPDLLTLRALRRLQDADVVLYDRLVNPQLLELVRRDAERINVGKQRDRHPIPQDEINRLLIHHARAGRQVVRLKGGDPFIFGRGGEEIAGVAEAGLSFEVVPGITAASGCAAYAGIPLTHRDHAASCLFVTGHRAAGGTLDLPWAAMVVPHQTVVVYMGRSTLADICAQLQTHGLDSHHPAAMVAAGTTDHQRVITGTLATLPDRVEQAQLSGPCLLITGTVVQLRDQLAWYDTTGSADGRHGGMDSA